MKKKFNAKDLLKGIADGLKVDNSDSVVDWILSNKLKTEDGYFVDYTDRKYLIEFMNDLSPRQAIMASAQVGKTVSMYYKALYLNYKGMNILFSEPTQDLRDMLTKSKLNRIIEQNPIFKANIKGGLDLKEAWDRMLFLVYTFGNANVGYSTDVNIYDEVSRSNGEAIHLFKARQLNSDHKYEWFISNPAQPHDLLHKTFLKSTQKSWFIKCSHCSRSQLLNYDGYAGFNGNVNKEAGILECQYCKRELHPQDVINGEWVKRFENREISGYHMHQLMRPTKTIEQQRALIKEMIYEEEKDKNAFMNMFLGLPYGGSDVEVSRELFFKNTTEQSQNGLRYLGLDVGSATGHHYICGVDDTIIDMGTFKDWKEVREYINRNNIVSICVDNNPERGAAVELQQDYPNMVWRCVYVGNKTEEIIKYKEEEGTVNVARNIVLDNIIISLDKGDYKFKYNEKDPKFLGFVEQFCNLSKISSFDSNGNPTFKWEAPEGAWDHYAHAFLYSQIARHRLEYLYPRFGVVKAEEEQSFTEHDVFSKKPKKDDWLYR